MQRPPPDRTSVPVPLDPSSAQAGAGIPSLVGGRFNGRYEIVRVLSSGGMGAVYEAVDAATGQPRAIKVMLPSLIRDAEARARFELEAQVIASIESPHVIRVFDVGIDEATELPFIVMELLHGHDLFTWLQREGRIAPETVVTYLSQLALGLANTHANGIVHRDLKPENIFVAEQPIGPPVVKVLDFGIAKVLDSGAHLTHAAMGTPLYMAPEQLGLAAELGPRADLHAVGHLAYTMLVGVPYWDRESREEGLFKLITKVCLGIEEAPSKRAAVFGVALEPSFDAWFARSVARLPQDRFASAIDQALALCDALGLPAPAGLAAAPPAAGEQRGRGTHELAQSYPAISASLARPRQSSLQRVLVAIVALLVIAVAALVVIIDRRVHAPEPGPVVASDPPQVEAAPPEAPTPPAPPATTNRSAPPPDGSQGTAPQAPTATSALAATVAPSVTSTSNRSASVRGGARAGSPAAPATSARTSAPKGTKDPLDDR